MLTKLFSATLLRRAAKSPATVLMLALIVFSNTAVFAQDLHAAKTNESAAKLSKEELAKEKPDAKPNSAELTKTVEALEERIRQLEDRLAKLTMEPAKAAPEAVKLADASVKTEVAAVQDDAKKEEVKKNDGVLKFFRDIEFSGIVDGYYSYNNNKVDMFTQGRAFDVRHNAFSLQLAKLTLNKANSKDDPLGFRVDLGLGETVDRVISVSDSSRNDATKHVLQAYASYVAPIGKGLTLDFGKFYTPVGAEVIETKDNFNYSRGWLFTYGPYYHAGLRAKYAFNDKVALTGFVMNGWDNVFENNVDDNAGKTFGFQVGLTPTKKFALTQTYLAGPEAPLANVPAASKRDNWRHIADTVATVFVNDKLTLLGNFVYGADGDNAGNRGKWTGGAAYFKYAFNNRFAFSPRFEVFNDKDGLRTGTAQTVKDITLTQEVKLVNNLLTRFEFRRDFSNQKFFTNSAGAARANQNTFIMGISYFFTNREP
ncbi:MAG TPA: outer membrane beta-barrel protein, partial [Blastocatellia bacterium]|nr:outer membrane beta-barrel protein [Blastocatellia bacterium]HMV86487.1 outer membrane beta-barrel protein [Blastocatellia bacterium]HMX28435.1 outer membrane beta-barrel protein [Blastocatellia bacterium]HMY76642.1 outer membrane beta-barrel protein [Blastocatellia bacterium]HMZ23246.1 outer membrane beta-barrel protein [Blastocatellia bacterium]